MESFVSPLHCFHFTVLTSYPVCQFCISAESHCISLGPGTGAGMGQEHILCKCQNLLMQSLTLDSTVQRR